jgi:hypothetical protein
MKTLWILAAAATFAACHNRADETGAAPDRGDSASVKSGYDTTQTTRTTAPADTVKSDTSSMSMPRTDSTTAPTTVPQKSTYDTTSTTAPQTPTYDTTSTSAPTTPSVNPAPSSSDSTMNPPSSTSSPSSTGTTSSDSSSQK